MRKQPPKIQLDFNLKKNFSPLSYICEAWNISTLGWLIKLFFNWNMELNSLKFLDYKEQAEVPSVYREIKNIEFLK